MISGSLPGDFDTTVNPGGSNGNFPSNGGGVFNGGGSGATGFPNGGADFDEGPNGGFGGNGGTGNQFGNGNGLTGPGGSNGVGGNGFGPNGPTGPNGAGGFPGGAPSGPDDDENAIDTGDNDDVNCDYLGTCYDGKNINLRNNLKTLFSIICSSVCPLQRHQNCCQCWNK